MLSPQLYYVAVAEKIHHDVIGAHSQSLSAIDAYGSPTLLHNKHMSLLSQEGTQQGDPLGMLLFSRVAQPIVLNIKSAVSAYSQRMDG